MFIDEGRPIWSVTELTLAIKEQLEDSFPLLRVEGEVSNCRPSGAGHVYFTLKDSGAVISAALFRGRAAKAAAMPKDGMQAVITGKIDVYPPRGSYQIIVEDVREAGRGAILEALERRKKALAAEGLFSVERKKSLPPYPRRVAVVTSPTGAAIRDILQVLSRRTAAPHITILPAAVQGAEAPAQIAAQIQRAAAYNLGDVLILARGGGSLEDLAAFNEEIVVRSVAACPLPLISGVGHEIDVSLADLAADVRAATPSAAAELVSDRSEDLLMRARGFRREALASLEGRLESLRKELRPLLTAELSRLGAGRVTEALRGSDDAGRALTDATASRTALLRKRLDLARQSLHDSSPQSVMRRGYARVSVKGKTVINAEILNSGDTVNVSFAQGEADAVVTDVRKE